MLGCVTNTKVQSFPQSVQQTHKYLKEAYSVTKQHLAQQYLRQKSVHDKGGTAEQLQIGDVIWLYTPVVKQGNTKKFSSFWNGPYTVIDKASSVNYKVQLLGGTQALIIHRNRLKLCYNACDHLPAALSSLNTSS